MADDKLMLEVEISARTQGLTGAQRQVSLLQDVVDATGRTLQMLPQATNAASAALQKLGSTAGSQKSRFDSLRESLRSTSKEMRDLAQAHVVKGGRDPLGTAASSMSVQQAKQIQAINKAANIDAVQAANERMRIANAEAAAQNRLLQGQRNLTSAKQAAAQQDMSALAAARSRLSIAQQELRSANAQRAGLSRGEDTPDRINARANSLNRVAEATRSVARAKGQVQAEERRIASAEASRVARERQSLGATLQVQAREFAAFQAAENRRVQIARDAANRVSRIAQEESASRARAYATARPGSVFAQGQLYDTGKAMKASETSWARQAQFVGRIQQDAHVVAYRMQQSRKEANALAQGSLPTLRYALYDVARASAIVQTAIAGIGLAAIAAAASYESSFTRVERTSGVIGTQTNVLRDNLLQLSREIPQSFESIATLASRGAQLGIAKSEIASFTDTVAKFVATSDTVSETEAAEAFGRISNLLGDKSFDRMGSAITFVGTRMAATEAQIIKTTQELAPFGASVGLSTDEVIGLAAAVASLGQPPERARSAFLTLQRVMDTAVASGSENLHAFGGLLGMTADQTAELWKQDPAQFISSFSTALGSVENLTTTFEALGINERRAVQVFQALAADARNSAGGISVLNNALEGAEKSYEENTELARQYGLIVDDLRSKWQLFLNSVMEFSATAGAALAPVAKVLLDIITAVMHALSNMASNEAGQAFFAIAAVAGTVVFVLASLVTVSALTLAGLAALKVALDQLSISAGTNALSLRGISGAFTQVALQAGISAGAITAFKWALAATGIGLAVVALGTLAAAFMSAGESADMTYTKFLGSSAGFAEAVEQDTADFLAGVEGSYTKVNSLIADNTETMAENQKTLSNTATVLGISGKGFDNLGEAIQMNTHYLGENTTAWLKNQLLQSAAFQELAGNQEFVDYWVSIGADMNEAIRLNASGGEQAVLDYFRRLENAALAGGAQFQRAFARQTAIGGEFLLSGAGRWGTVSGRGLADINKVLSGQTNQYKLLGDSTRRAGTSATIADNLYEDFGETLKDTGGAASGAAKEIRTLVDYANDLSSVWGRAFDIRFGGMQGLDDITKSFIDIREAADEAAKRIRDLKNDIAGLTSDIDIQEYFLGIALEYGDTKRAAAIEADLAKKRAELADKTLELQDQQDAVNKSLTGNSKSAIENRSEILGLVTQYQSYLEALAASGISQGALAAKSEELRQDFIAQATALGYNREELRTFEASFTDVARTIAAVPFGVTTDLSSLDPAALAIAEFVEEANAKLNSLGSGMGGALNDAFGDAELDALNGGNLLGEAAMSAWDTYLQDNMATDLAHQTKNAGENTSVRRSSSLAGGEVAKGVLGTYGGTLASEMALSTSRAIFNQPGSLETARAFGGTLAVVLKNSVSNYLDMILGGQTSTPRRALRNIIGFQTGGFTGRGGTSQAAGIVHAGEYVIPKSDVNQSTGMPYADALGRLMQGIPSKSTAPSQGSGNSSGTATVALTAGTIQAIAQATGKLVVLDGRVIADSSAQSYSNDNVVGAY